MPDDESTSGPDRVERGERYPGPRSSYGYRETGLSGAVVSRGMPRRRRRRPVEYAMPAAVILAAVLIVVAFALIINRALHSKDSENSIPLPQSPPLGSTSAPSAQPVIPLPSASASGSATPSAGATSTPAPSRKAPPAAVDNGSIRIVRSGVPPLVDLSAEGTRDWVHWGEQSTFSLERDAKGGFAILEGAPTAPRFRHALSTQLFSWEGGSPVSDSDGTPTGVRTCGKGNGFTLSAPAATSNRTLRLYIGVLAGRGRLEAKLSTGGPTRTATLEQRNASLATASFVVTYRAPRNGTLRLNWITEQSFSSDCGGVSLQAATLR